MAKSAAQAFAEWEKEKEEREDKAHQEHRHEELPSVQEIRSLPRHSSSSESLSVIQADFFSQLAITPHC